MPCTLLCTLLIHILPLVVFQEGDNIFTYESKEGKNLSLMIDQFLWYLCKQLTANTQILATFEKTMRIFLSFLRHVSKSEVDALRLTAYIFGAFCIVIRSI